MGVGRSVLGIASACTLACTGLSESPEGDAEATYTSFFSTPLADVRVDDSGGMHWIEIDLWVRVTATPAPTPRRSDLAICDPAQPARWFLSMRQEDALLLTDPKNLTALCAESQDGQAGDWLLRHEREGVSWYRSWVHG